MNPWENISLSDYENHMSLDSVKQLQAMNKLMQKQFEEYPVTTAIVFGIAGGNGLEHVNKRKYKKVYGIDINETYLNAVKERYSKLGDILECYKINVINESDKLPKAELVIANLFIEYVGYNVFKKAILKSNPKYVSCIIQINTDEETWVSNSPYIHAFDGLDKIHHQIEENALINTMNEIGYKLLKTETYPLPNRKKLVMLDFEH
ncbi:methyltransferase type 11 [Methanobrevibacter sp. 87.7]|uniref:class I SAM-dependent methyltransferase n=1 Tax=Methanobrevibacter sp. 87.7 TaxID=387957 RepID=UPI000B50FC54|nr:class I SAM-dependent methyltransferase [Methanobrevibacter sp. 87.7]OWT32572.1 methyltransferase type 11 [Methanobrevibacter sp. 87.7]